MLRQKFIIIVITATFFGFFSGLVGAIVSWTYLVKDAFNVPMFGDINFANRTNSSSLVIRDAKKVVVEQNLKVDEVARSAREGLVGIYKKNISQSEKEKKISGDTKASKEKKPAQKNDLSVYTDIKKYQGQGFVITSDGWIITDYLPDDVAKLLVGVKSTSTVFAMRDVLESYSIVDKNGMVYAPLEVINDVYTGYAYWKIKASDLPVKKFVAFNEIKNGQIALAVNFKGWTWLTSVVGISSQSNLLKSSDDFHPDIVLSEKAGSNFYSSFLFDLNGDFLGVIDQKGISRPISNFLNCIDCLLTKKAISRPSLGVHYIDLAGSIKESELKSQEGALLIGDEKNPGILSDSPAAKNGLKDGDIIIAVNGLLIDKVNDLASVISQFKPSEKIVIDYLRNGEKKQLDLILGKL